MQISRRLLDVAHRLDGLRAEAESSDDVVPIETLELDSEPIVPIESLAPSPVGGLETSFRTFERLIKERAPVTPSFAALFAGSPAAPAAEEAAVAIDTLCYTGQAALERADTVRRQISAELARNASMASLQPLLEELLDLVPLALVKS